MTCLDIGVISPSVSSYLIFPRPEDLPDDFPDDSRERVIERPLLSERDIPPREAVEERLAEGEEWRAPLDERPLFGRLETSCWDEDGRLPENDGRFPDEPFREGRADDPDGRDDPLE